MIDYLCGALCHVHLVGLQNSNDRLFMWRPMSRALSWPAEIVMIDYLCGALCHVHLVGLQNSNDRLFMWRPMSRALSWPAE